MIAILIYVLYRRHRGATYAQIIHAPLVRSNTPQLTPTPMREKFNRLPIYHTVDYSIRSSRRETATSLPPQTLLAPSGPNGRTKHRRIQSDWKDPNAPPTTPTKPLPLPPTFLLDASPKTKPPKTPEKAHVSVRPMSQVSRKSSMRKQPSAIARASVTTSKAPYTCNSPLLSPPALEDVNDRWSWTNSQAPSTPRLNPESRRGSLASKYSVPRFRSVVSWALGQGERIRIDEEAPPLLTPTTLQPVPANKRAFKDSAPPDLSRKATSKSKSTVKSHKKTGSSLGNLGGFLKFGNNAKSSASLPLSVQHQQPDIEMKNQHRKSR